MTLKGKACRLTVYVGEDDQWHHKPLYTEIVHRAHAFGLAGASAHERVATEKPPTVGNSKD
jgi:uncharacterized protein